MRVLYTGFTALQVQPPKHATIAKASIPWDIVTELRRQGHEVDWRPLAVGEVPAPGHYDAIFVSVAPANSTNAPASLNGMWALWVATHFLRVPTGIVWEDWQYGQVKNGCRTVRRLGHKQLRKALKSNDGGGSQRLYHMSEPEDVERHADALLHAAGFVSGEVPHPDNLFNVVPLFMNWGDRRIAEDLIPKSHHPILPIDTSGSHVFLPETKLQEAAADFGTRRHSWLCPSLMSMRDWVESKVKPQWPVVYAGNLLHHRLGLETRIRSEQLVELEHVRHLGSLASEYPDSGSGRMRSRYVYAARGGTVLLCSEADGRALGPAYQLTAAQVEGSTRAEIEDLAAAQRARWAEVQSPPDALYQTVKIITEALSA